MQYLTQYFVSLFSMNHIKTNDDKYNVFVEGAKSLDNITELKIKYIFKNKRQCIFKYSVSTKDSSDTNEYETSSNPETVLSRWILVLINRTVQLQPNSINSIDCIVELFGQNTYASTNITILLKDSNGKKCSFALKLTKDTEKTCETNLFLNKNTSITDMDTIEASGKNNKTADTYFDIDNTQSAIDTQSNENTLTIENDKVKMSTDNENRYIYEYLQDEWNEMGAVTIDTFQKNGKGMCKVLDFVNPNITYGWYDIHKNQFFPNNFYYLEGKFTNKQSILFPSKGKKCRVRVEINPNTNKSWIDNTDEYLGVWNRYESVFVDSEMEQ